jgi:hypothetical protein
VRVRVRVRVRGKYWVRLYCFPSSGLSATFSLREKGLAAN